MGRGQGLRPARRTAVTNIFRMFAVGDVTRNATRSSGAPGGDLQPTITQQPQSAWYLSIG